MKTMLGMMGMQMISVMTRMRVGMKSMLVTAGGVRQGVAPCH